MPSRCLVLLGQPAIATADAVGVGCACDDARELIMARRHLNGVKHGRHHKGGKGGHPWKWMREGKRPRREAMASTHWVRVWRDGKLNWPYLLGAVGE